MLDFRRLGLHWLRRSLAHEMASRESIVPLNLWHIGGVSFILVGGVGVVGTQMSDVPKEFFSSTTLLQLLNIAVGVIVIFTIKYAIDRLLNLFTRVSKLELRVHDLDGKKDGERNPD